MRRHHASAGRGSQVAVCVVAVSIAAACAAEPDRAPSVGGADTSSAGVVAEARSFMDAYARELLAGDRAAIAARYDRSGAFFLINGRKEFSTHDSITARYAGPEWSPPVSFEWQDLTFEPVGPDAVVVLGTFLWGPKPAATPLRVSYAALLRHQDGVLRIRLENESIVPFPDSAGRPPADTGRR